MTSKMTMMPFSDKMTRITSGGSYQDINISKMTFELYVNMNY